MPIFWASKEYQSGSTRKNVEAELLINKNSRVNTSLYRITPVYSVFHASR